MIKVMECFQVTKERSYFVMKSKVDKTVKEFKRCDVFKSAAIVILRATFVEGWWLMSLPTISGKVCSTPTQHFSM